MGMGLECTEKQIQRPIQISDSVGQFALSTGDNGQKVLADDPHITSPAISKIRETPWLWPTGLGDGKPLKNREVIRVLRWMDFFALNKVYEISDHIVTDAIWRSTPSIILYWGFQHYAKLHMGPSGERVPPQCGMITHLGILLIPLRVNIVMETRCFARAPLTP